MTALDSPTTRPAGADTAVTVPTAAAGLTPWVDAGVFGPAEVHGAAVVARADGGEHPLVVLAAACALWAPLHGHSCVDLDRIGAVVRSELARTRADSDRGDDSLAVVDGLASSLPWPAPDEWVAELASSPIVRVVTAVDLAPVLDDAALVLHGRLLYTQRQWVDECSVAELLLQRADADAPAPLTPAAQTLLERLLPSDDDGTPNLQHAAARAALTSRLGVIVGGPGTGKTHTVARLLAVLQADALVRGTTLRIGLAAPTGKAAGRMRDAIIAAAAAGRSSGDLGDADADRLAELETSTIHRLLGWRNSSTRFRHDRDQPLPHDVVVIDEASMVALPLMARLLEAIRPEARLVLVGDPDQLHSIEVGAVLADVVAAAEAEPSSSLHRCVVRLRRPRRQRTGSPIGPLADAVRDGRTDEVLRLLRVGATDAAGNALLTFSETADALASAPAAGVRSAVVGPLVDAARAAAAGDAASALDAFAQVRVLCAHRRGRHGVEAWNRAIESWLIAEPAADLAGARSGRFYPGRPLLATRNDLRQRVANGDTGIVVRDPGGVRAAFATAAGVRLLAPAQLERVETAFATTIHKSQGGEHAIVVVVVPPDSSPLVGRELLYTALTRSSERLLVVGTAAAIASCVNTPSRRITGLAAALRR